MSTHRSVQERSPADDGRPERATTASGALTELLEIAAESLGGHTALVCGDERVGYDELAERVARLAHGLAGLGVSPGDRVALVMRDTPAFVVSFLAVAGLQARVVPLNPHFKEAELAFCLRDCGVRAVIADADKAGLCRDLVSAWDEGVEIIAAGEAGPGAPTVEGLIAASSAMSFESAGPTKTSSCSTRPAAPAARSRSRAPTPSCAPRPTASSRRSA